MSSLKESSHVQWTRLIGSHVKEEKLTNWVGFGKAHSLQGTGGGCSGFRTWWSWEHLRSCGKVLVVCQNWVWTTFATPFGRKKQREKRLNGEKQPWGTNTGENKGLLSRTMAEALVNSAQGLGLGSSRDGLYEITHNCWSTRKHWPPSLITFVQLPNVSLRQLLNKGKGDAAANIWTSWCR